MGWHASLLFLCAVGSPQPAGLEAEESREGHQREGGHLLLGFSFSGGFAQQVEGAEGALLMVCQLYCHLLVFSLLIYCFTLHEVRAHHLQGSRPQYSTGSFVTWSTAQSERMSSISQTNTRRSSAPPTSRRVCVVWGWGRVLGSGTRSRGCTSEHGIRAMARVIASNVICFPCPCSNASRSSAPLSLRLKLTSPHKKAELCDSRVEF